MTQDLEDRLRLLLHDGAPDPPGRISMGDLAARRRRRRLHGVGTPIAAVAVVAAIAVGVPVASRVIDHRSEDRRSAAGGAPFRFGGRTPVGTTIPVKERLAAGPVSGELLAGGRYSSVADTDHVVVYDVGGTWCAPCVAQSVSYAKVALAFKSTGVSFVRIEIDDPSRGEALDYFLRVTTPYPIIWDPQFATRDQLGGLPRNAVPLTVIVDRRGGVAAVYVGVVDGGVLSAVLRRVAAGE